MSGMGNECPFPADYSWSGEHCRKSVLMHFQLESTHLMVTNLLFFYFCDTYAYVSLYVMCKYADDINLSVPEL